MQLTGHYFFDIWISFAAGVLVSFTPCIYPVLPITAGFIAGFNTEGTRFKGFIISLVYVLGLALTYCTFGVIAALSGKVFGQLQNHPLIYIAVANILFFFALVMSDLVPLPALGTRIHQKVVRKSLWTVLFFGASSGMIVGPCTAPVLGTLLLYVASKQNLFQAVSLLFFFSYGVGTSLILVGTFSGLIGALPKPGPWLVRIKQVCGVILIIAGEYFLVKAGGLF